LAVGVLAVGGVFAWILFIRDDAPPALGTSDLDDALAGSDTTAAGAGGSTPATDGAAAAPVAAGDVSGTWTISPDSTLGYRVQEVLGGVDTEGAGRTNQVT